MTTMRARLVFCLVLAAACLPGAGAAPLAQAGAQTDEQIHDAANPARQQLQSSAEAVQGLPRDKHGAVDWVRALRNGVITPRADLDGRQGAQVLDLDVLDPSLMPAVDSPLAGGMKWQELSRLLRALTNSELAVGMNITIFDPDKDPDGSLARTPSTGSWARAERIARGEVSESTKAWNMSWNPKSDKWQAAGALPELARLFGHAQVIPDPDNDIPDPD